MENFFNSDSMTMSLKVYEGYKGGMQKKRGVGKKKNVYIGENPVYVPEESDVCLTAGQLTTQLVGTFYLIYANMGNLVHDMTSWHLLSCHVIPCLTVSCHLLPGHVM